MFRHAKAGFGLTIAAVVSGACTEVGGPQDAMPTQADGAAFFAKNCSSCHGADGKGDREFGAPNLADAIALYGTSRGELKAQIHKPKHGVMPPWGDKLGETGVKQLAIYVHGLGGGEKAKAE